MEGSPIHPASYEIEYIPACPPADEAGKERIVLRFLIRGIKLMISQDYKKLEERSSGPLSHLDN